MVFEKFTTTMAEGTTGGQGRLGDQEERKDEES